MRPIFLFLTFLLSVSSFSQLRIGVITDTHYLSDRLMDGGSAVDEYMSQTGRMIKYGNQILDSVFSFYSKANIDVLLVCGDITKDGERDSHIDFVRRMEHLQANGTKVFVIPGNHDINMPRSFSYIGNNTHETENISPLEFENVYANCGYASAIMRDESSLSYVARLDSATWLLAIDAARYNEYKLHSLSSGQISATTEKWINEVLERAKEEKVVVLGMMHWGLVEHFPYQSVLLKDYLISDWNRLSELWANKGMKVIFTGHCHANDITKYNTPTKNVIYDIETGSLCSYPFSYRLVDYSSDQMKISTMNITSVGSNKNIADESKQILLRLAKNIAKTRLKEISENYSSEAQVLFADFMAQVFLLHLKGDEILTPQMYEIAHQLEQMTDGQSGDITGLEIELPPADNNLTIIF